MKISKKISKKILALVLCGVISVGVLPSSVFAVEPVASISNESIQNQDNDVKINSNDGTIKTVKLPDSKRIKVKVNTNRVGKGYLKISVSNEIIIGNEKNKKPAIIEVKDGNKISSVKLLSEKGKYNSNLRSSKTMYTYILPVDKLEEASFEICDENDNMVFDKEFLISVDSAKYINEINPSQSIGNMSINNIEATSQYEESKIYEGFVFGNIDGEVFDTFVFRPEANSDKIKLYIGAMSKNGFNYSNYGKDNKFIIEYFNTEDTYNKIQKKPNIKDKNGKNKYKDSEYKKVEVSVSNKSTVELPWYPDNGIIKIKLNNPNTFLFRLSVERRVDTISNKKIENANENNRNEIPTTDRVNSNIARIEGADRYDTSIKLSKEVYDNSNTVVVSSGENYADSLSGAPLAKYFNAPLLLMNNDKNVIRKVKEEINRLGAKKIYVLGGNNSINPKSEESLRKGNDIDVIRLSGKNRYETSVEVYNEFTKYRGNSSNVVFVNGNEFADALSAGMFAAKNKMAIILTDGHESPSKNLDKKSKYNTIIGGYSSIDSTFAGNRINGKDRYETSLNVAKTFKSPKNIIIASGEKYPDGLSSITLYNKYEAPLLLTPYKNMQMSAKNYIKDSAFKKIFVVGGRNSISLELEKNLRK